MGTKKTKYDGSFTVDWFSEHEHLWKKYLKRFSTRKKCVTTLMVGAYEGMVLAWLFDNVLNNNKASHATVIDRFDYDACVYYEGHPYFNPGVKERFYKNIVDKYGNKRVTVFDGLLSEFVPPLKRHNGSNSMHLYDIIYIDARDSIHALSSMTRTFEFLAPKGVMIVQNYAHNINKDSTCPRRGIDAFVDVYAPSKINILSNTFHFFLEKHDPQNSTSRACHIEGYPIPDKEWPDCDKSIIKNASLTKIVPKYISKKTSTVHSQSNGRQYDRVLK